MDVATADPLAVGQFRWPDGLDVRLALGEVVRVLSRPDGLPEDAGKLLDATDVPQDIRLPDGLSGGSF